MIDAAAIRAAAVLLFAATPLGAQSLLNSFSTIAMQRCLAAVETGTAPRARTLFSGDPKAGALPEDMFAPIGYWLTSDDRIYLTQDTRGNCAVGDTLASEDPQAHENAIRRFEAWGNEEAAEGRYIDANLAEETFAYRRTYVSTGWSGTPILVTLVSDQKAGLLALIAERSEVVTDDPDAPQDDTTVPSNLLNKAPQEGVEVNRDNSL